MEKEKEDYLIELVRSIDMEIKNLRSDINKVEFLEKRDFWEFQRLFKETKETNKFLRKEAIRWAAIIGSIVAALISAIFQYVLPRL